MSVYCNTCGRFIATNQPLLDAREFQRLHTSQTGHWCVIKGDT